MDNNDSFEEVFYHKKTRMVTPHELQICKRNGRVAMY